MAGEFTDLEKRLYADIVAKETPSVFRLADRLMVAYELLDERAHSTHPDTIHSETELIVIDEYPHDSIKTFQRTFVGVSDANEVFMLRPPISGQRVFLAGFEVNISEMGKHTDTMTSGIVVATTLEDILQLIDDDIAHASIKHAAVSK